MPKTWDIIVIGAGLGGLLAAALLAKRGRTVLLLEREAQAGGRLRSYEVDGFVIDNGAYLWPNRYLGGALAEAGAGEFRASRIPPTQVMRLFVQGCGQRFSFPWPGRGDSESMRAAASAALAADPACFAALRRLWEELAALPDATVRSLQHVTLGDALPRFTTDSDVARAFRRNVMLFGTYDPDSASMAECIGLRRRPRDVAPPVPECPGANPGGGVRALPAALHRAAQRAGVDVRLGCAVDQIDIDAGRVTGVFTHQGGPFRQRFDAPIVVSNIPIWQLFEVVSPARFPDAFVDNARHFAVVGGTIGAAFAFKDRPRLRETGAQDDFLGWTRLLIGPDREFGGGMVWTTLHSPDNAPAGAHVLQAMRLSPYADIVDAYRVNWVLDRFREMLDEIYLDLREQLMWQRSWATRDGSEYMITATPKPPIQAPGIEGLYFVGETTDVPAVQMDAAALSALRCAELVCAQHG